MINKKDEVIRIEDDVTYLLIPKNEDGIELKTRKMDGASLKQHFAEDALLKALNDGNRHILFKGNEYFLDIKVTA